MTAGESARSRAVEVSEDASRLEALARAKRREAANYRKAAESEAGLAGVLAPLRDSGWVVLEDRRWPGSRANVDFIVIGPSGVIVLDAKDWRDVRVEDDTLYRGDAPQDDQIDKLHRLLDVLHASVEHTGLTPSNLLAALVFTGRDLRLQLGATWLLGDQTVVSWLLALPSRLSPADVAALARALDEACPDANRPSTVALQGAVPTVDILPGLEDLVDAMIASELAAPIEDWMVFLHPDQNRLVRSQWNGPARLRGAAGSGKTTVALHRAVYLALRSRRPVLFVTFVRTLPRVMRGVVERMSPFAASGIEFSGLHQKAREILRSIGERPRIDSDAIDGAFSDAWMGSGMKHHLHRIHSNPNYWHDEIDYVIKGRGLTDFESYAEVRRVGRATRLQKGDRGAVWTLFQHYEKALVRRGTIDFTDLITRAHRAITDDPSLAHYSSVIVDEVQDLTMVGLKFLDALSGDGANRLLIVGDGQQAIYPGGFSLSEAGISVVGRANVLDRNYRNTVQILQTADRVVADAEFYDIEGTSETAAAIPGIRDGAEPVSFRGRTLAEVDAALSAHLDVLQTRYFVSPADTAVLTPGKADAAKITRLLRASGREVVTLEQYDGLPIAAIKVGTIKRAKGLEFKAVLLPRADGTPRWDGESDEGYAERRALEARELFVGMTRARDHLWIGSVGAQAPKE